MSKINLRCGDRRGTSAPLLGAPWRFVAMFTVLLLSGVLAWAGESDAPPSSAPTSEPTTTSTTSTGTSTAGVEEEPDRFLAVINGDVYTVNGPALRGATILSKNGRIVEIGTDVRLPEECEVIDADGKRVYPGLVAASAGGLHGGGNAADTTNVFSANMQVALAGGITTAIAGNDAAKLTFGTTEDMIVKKGLYTSLDYSRRRPLQRAETRSAFEAARAHLRALDRYEIERATNEDAEKPEPDEDVNRRYLKLIRGSATAVATANSRQDLLDLAALAREFGFRLIVRGAYEGWTVAPQIAGAIAGAIVTPRASVFENQRSVKPSGSSIENAQILRRHGIPVAIVPPTTSITFWGLAGRDLLHLNMEAGFAVRGGMSDADALRAVTIDAARILGIDDHVGSLEIGKDADWIVCDGDLLHYMTQVHYAVVNGRIAYNKQKETLFAHIRPDGAPETTFDDVWPRRLEWPANDDSSAAAEPSRE